MGNTLGGKKKTTKIMKINGETIKFKTPVKVEDIVKDYPGHVVLDSEAVRNYGIRAKPLDPYLSLQPKRLYFLVELPKFPQDHQRVPRRVRSAIQMSAKDRLENLMLSRRSVSDLSIMGHTTRIEVEGSHSNSVECGGLTPSGGTRVKMRLPKAQVEKLMSQSRDREEMVEKIINMCSPQMGDDVPKCDFANEIENVKEISLKGKAVANDNNTPTFFNQSIARSPARYKRRVNFLPIHEGGESGIAIAAS